MLLLIFFLVLHGYNKMKPSKVSYQNIKQKMKFDNQELSVLTNDFRYPGREVINENSIALLTIFGIFQNTKMSNLSVQ